MMTELFPNIKVFDEKVRQGTPKYNFNYYNITNESVDVFEQAYGILLSKSYKQFLKKYNGGMITRRKWTSYIDMTEYEIEHPTRDSFMLFGYDDVVDNYTSLKLDNWMMPKDFNGNYPIIPICKMPELKGEYLFVFSEKGLDGESPVFAFLGGLEKESCFKVANDFNDFLGLLMEHDGFPPILKMTRDKTAQDFIVQNNIIEIASEEETDEKIIIRNSALIELNPNRAWLYCDRGVAYWNQKENKLALTDLNKAIELDSNEPFFYFHRGMIISDYASKRKALIDFDVAVKLDSYSKLFLWARATCFYNLEKYEKALDDCNTVLKIDNENIMALKSRIMIYFALGEAVKAEADILLLDKIIS